jgi:hypothetical protein
MTEPYHDEDHFEFPDCFNRVGLMSRKHKNVCRFDYVRHARDGNLCFPIDHQDQRIKGRCVLA